jgi:hypothetical protein
MRPAVTWVIFLLLVTVCGGRCQGQRPSDQSPQAPRSVGSVVRQARRREPDARGSLPDAPSSYFPARARISTTDSDAAHSLPAFQSIAAELPDKEPFTHLIRPNLDETPFMLQQRPNNFLDNYMNQLRQLAPYHPSSTQRILDRAGYAVFRDLIVRDNSGNRSLNTSYLLKVMTSGVVSTARRPYWERSPSDTFNNFGSTIGSNMGTNFFHEFWPGIRETLNSHAPTFVKRIEQGISQTEAAR